MAYNISVSKDSKIIICNHRGIIDRDELGTAWQEILNQPEFLELNYNFLTDIRETTIDLPVEELLSTIDVLNSFEYTLNGKRMAFVANTPITTVLTMLFEYRMPKDLGMLTKTFSTQEAALNFVKKQPLTEERLFLK